MSHTEHGSGAESYDGVRRRPLVTVYIPCHDYGHFLQQAIDSVLGQLLTSWELILIDDASSDDTARICAACRDRHPERVRVIRNESASGLAHNANLATSAARGKYLMRLDADDWLDEAALLVLSRYLDDHPQVALVYPNYFYVDAQGRFLGVEHRKRIGPETGLLDLPAHGACTMVRKRVMRAIGGYDEQHKAQDGYDLWLKVLHRYPVGNVETPLFYYRQHSSSLSRDSSRLLDARQRIKRSFLEQRKGSVRLETAAVIPAKNTYPHMEDVVLAPLAGRPLIDWTLDAALGCEQIDEIVVTTDDERVAAYASSYHAKVRGMLRPRALSEADRRLSEVLFDAAERMEDEMDLHPDILVMLSLHSPLRTARDVAQAIDTLVLFDADSVVTVYQDLDLHLVHGKNGLEPLNPAMVRQVRLEREGLYVQNGAVVALWRDALTPEQYLGERISHVEMPRESSFQIKSNFDRWLVERILERRRTDQERSAEASPRGGSRRPPIPAGAKPTAEN